MAANINRVVLVGNLTKDPELRHTPGGTPVCSLRIAVNSRRRDEPGQWTDKPNYFSVSVVGNQAESCAQYLSKGRPVAIDGRLEWREWEAKDGGGKREAVEIVADSVQFRQPRRRRGRGRQPVRAGGGAGERRLPGRSRRRHPVLGEAWPERSPSNSSSGPAGRPAPSRSGTASSARRRSPRSTTRTSTNYGATSPRRGRSAAAASRAPAGATRCRSRR